MKYDLNSKDFETEYKIKDIVTINNVDYKIKKSSSFDNCSECSFIHSDPICMKIGDCLVTKNGKEIPIHFKKIGGKNMKEKKIIAMIDEEMEKVDRLMNERDYDGASCLLTDLVWTIREKLYKKIIKEGDNNDK